MDAVRELDVVGVRVEMPSNQPIVLLRESDGERYLPIWIGAVEATAIAFAQQGMTPPRPLTHDLFKDVLDALGARLEQVLITEMRDSTYYAELVFSGGVRVSSRPSDSIAIALRMAAAIYTTEDLLETTAIEITDASEHDFATGPEEDKPAGPTAGLTPEQLREYLRRMNPEDFGRFNP